MKTKRVRVLYGTTGVGVRVPAEAAVLEGRGPGAIEEPRRAVREALERPIGTGPLRELVARKRPRSVAITVSDITRPVPNAQFLPAMLDLLNGAGVPDGRITIVIGKGMHRPSTPAEQRTIVGEEAIGRVAVIDHNAEDAAGLVRVCGEGELGPGEPPVSVCRRFAEADFRIVTGLIEPHFMAGFSGGRKGVCPALVDLATVQRFHGYRTLSDARADNGVLADNPCHAIALKVARAVGVDFLFNVAMSRDRRMARIYCGELEAAHAAGCAEVAGFTSAEVAEPYDLVITSAGGHPLDLTFYQAVKGMVTALPAVAAGGTLLQVAACAEGLGSRAYTQTLLAYGADWERFLRDIAADARTRLDQWQVQMQARVLRRLGVERLWFASDGLPAEIQGRIGVRPLLGAGDAAARAQGAIDRFLAERPGARVAVIPEGPYTMIRG